MRRKLSLLISALNVMMAGQAEAGALPFTGSLSISIQYPNGPTLPLLVVTGTGTAVVNNSGGLGHLNSLSLPASGFATVGHLVAVTDPAPAAIKAVQGTLHNGTGNFVGGTNLGTLGGTMPLQGVAKLCLFTSCVNSPPANISVPLSVVGAGGAQAVNFLVNIIVTGAPWQTGTVTVGGVTAMGFAHGPASATSSTANPSGVVTLVTPIFISTGLASFAAPPAFGFLTLHFVPEPSTLLLLGSGIAGMMMFARSRRV